MRPFCVEAPEQPLVTYGGTEGLKKHCRCDTDEEQALIEAFEAAAVAWLDGYSGHLGRCVLRQKWALPLMVRQDSVALPFPDCRDFAVERLMPDGIWSEIEHVSIQADRDYAILTDLPGDRDGLHLTFWAGWNSVDAVPEHLKQVVRMLVAHWYGNRSAVAPGAEHRQLPLSVEAMLRPLRHVCG